MTATLNPATMTIDGETYALLPAIIEATHLGFEDHGLFTGWLDLDYGSGGHQGAGLMVMSVKDGDGRQCVTDHGADWIARVLEVVGVDYWEELPRRRVYAVKPATDKAGTVAGLAALGDPTGRFLLFGPHAAGFPRPWNRSADEGAPDG